MTNILLFLLLVSQFAAMYEIWWLHRHPTPLSDDQLRHYADVQTTEGQRLHSDYWAHTVAESDYHKARIAALLSKAKER